MATQSPLSAVVNATVTVLFCPGILTHEYAHVLACRLLGIAVIESPSLGLFEGAATMDHEAVTRFDQDFGIAIAPFVVNSLLGITAFALYGVLPAPLDILPLWAGITFGITALPSPDDTKTLLRGVRTLPGPLKPVGYVLAVPTRAVSVSLFVAGLLGLLWTRYLFVLGATG